MTINVDAPVRVRIEITGECLGDIHFGLGDIAAALHSGKTSGSVDPGTSEGYTFTVEAL